MSWQADLLPDGLKARLVAPRVPALIEVQVHQFIVALEGLFEEPQGLFFLAEPRVDLGKGVGILIGLPTRSRHIESLQPEAVRAVFPEGAPQFCVLPLSLIGSTAL